MKLITLKFLFVLSSALFILHSRTYAQELFESTQFGIKMSKPQNWIAATNTDLQKNLDKVNFNDEELQKVLNSNKGILTLSTYYKYKIDSVAGLIPTIKVTVRANSAPTMADFKEVMVASTDRVKTVVKNFEFIENFREVDLCGLSSLYYNCRYSLTLAKGDNIKIRNRYYMIPKGAYFISISLMDNETTEDCSQVLDKFIKSLQLTK
jgi:hypothetical protein